MERNTDNQTPYYAPKKTLYKGKWMKSRLEARVAQSLDALDIPWEYEQGCFVDSRFEGGQYTPDFYLPDQGIYIEVAGVWDRKHVSKVQALECILSKMPGYDEDNPRVLGIDTNGYIVWPDPCGNVWPDDRYLAQCPRCKGWLTLDNARGWGCECGNGGDNFKFVSNLFEEAGYPEFNRSNR